MELTKDVENNHETSGNVIKSKNNNNMINSVPESKINDDDNVNPESTTEQQLQPTAGNLNERFKYHQCKLVKDSAMSTECWYLIQKYEGFGPELDCTGDKADYDSRCPGYGTPGSGNISPNDVNTRGNDDNDDNKDGSLYACDAPEDHRSSLCDITSDEHQCYSTHPSKDRERACKALEDDASQGPGNTGWVGPNTNECIEVSSHKGFSPPCVKEP